LSRFHYEARRVWRKRLARRKCADRYPWKRFVRLLARYPLLKAEAIHSVCRPAANP
jgi:hypothetical protein